MELVEHDPVPGRGRGLPRTLARGARVLLLERAEPPDPADRLQPRRNRRPARRAGPRLPGLHRHGRRHGRQRVDARLDARLPGGPHDGSRGLVAAQLRRRDVRPAQLHRVAARAGGDVRVDYRDGRDRAADLRWRETCCPRTKGALRPPYARRSASSKPSRTGSRGRTRTSGPSAPGSRSSPRSSARTAPSARRSPRCATRSGPVRREGDR